MSNVYIFDLRKSQARFVEPKLYHSSYPIFLPNLRRLSKPKLPSRSYESMQLPAVVEEVSLNATQYNVTATDDKNFWAWLSSLISAGGSINGTTELPRPAAAESCLPCKCGLTNTQKRIVGGVETQINQYPWMVLMMFRGRFYCGGSVISSRYVLTAAHCVDRFDPNLMSIRILEHDRNSTTESETQEFKVEKVIKHSGYSTFNYNNDIALVKLKDAIRFEGKMRPVCLPEQGDALNPLVFNDNVDLRLTQITNSVSFLAVSVLSANAGKTFAGLNGTVTGWGAVQEAGAISQTLQEVTVPILTNAQCRASGYPSRRITDNMLCAGYEKGKKDSCQGDSGGPLHIINNDTYQVVEYDEFRFYWKMRKNCEIVCLVHDYGEVRFTSHLAIILQLNGSTKTHLNSQEWYPGARDAQGLATPVFTAGLELFLLVEYFFRELKTFRSNRRFCETIQVFI
ncbi:Serine proteinase stubble [Melipona quadrifasciata]|uniref:Serine proteinase stubble n=1 Tax=Melipona quadrifasciata TaxID=166423 RepID=A0A0M8ZVI2_9HYME|nr:Serine proteinase stubble [Melipona quadrifasciata]